VVEEAHVVTQPIWQLGLLVAQVADQS
jgi:hypothetical protein